MYDDSYLYSNHGGYSYPSNTNTYASNDYDSYDYDYTNIVTDNSDNSINDSFNNYTFNPQPAPVAAQPITIVNNNYNNNVNTNNVPAVAPAPVYTPPVYDYAWGGYGACDCVVLSHLPYTGAYDYMYTLVLLTIVLTAGYVLYHYGIMGRNARFGRII
jgi:hypothetical protein